MIDEAGERAINRWLDERVEQGLPRDYVSPEGLAAVGRVLREVADARAAKRRAAHR